jgi:hypothetical protein
VIDFPAMDEKVALGVLYALGSKFFELQQGFATIYNLCLRRGVFTETAFHQEREKILQFPDLQHWAAILADLKAAMERGEIEDLLRRFEGPIQ